MRDVCLFALAFSITMSVSSFTAPDFIKAGPWLSDNFDRLDFKMCGDYWSWEPIPNEIAKYSGYKEECGVIPIPNLKLPTELGTSTFQ
jgi:hypothetical protein